MNHKDSARDVWKHFNDIFSMKGGAARIIHADGHVEHLTGKFDDRKPKYEGTPLVPVKEKKNGKKD